MSNEPGKPVFVVGDVHGHIERLEALLMEADVDGKDCTVVQLGDLAHIGEETRGGDREAWFRAKHGWVDVVLWGNHDRAVVDANHKFGGYADPEPEVKHLMRSMEADGRLLMAYEAHGWLLTHAGLHKAFKHQAIDIDKTDPRAVADWINERGRTGDTEPVIDAISRHRGGWSSAGGILWRDIEEKLYDAFPQVFGHSASRQRIVRGEADKWYCVDIGGKGGLGDTESNCLAGIWLPSQEIVRVQL